MGKASSSKKVARAAGLGGGRAYAKRPAWGYYFGVLVLLVLGVLGVYNSREYRSAAINKQGNTAPTVHQKPPWFEGYTIDECGKILPPIKTTKDPYGITTKAGVISVSPTVKAAAGRNATLGKFASSIGMTLNAGALETPGGRLWQDGDTCEGKAGHVYVMTWASPAELPQNGVLQNAKGVPSSAGVPNANGLEDTCNPDCDSGVLLENDQLVTIAFLPAPKKGSTPVIPQPSTAIISKLNGQVSTGGTTTTAAPALPTTAVPAGKTTTTAASTNSSVPTGTTTSVPKSSAPTTSVPKTTTTKAK
ncbi:MAG TPA: hypothetical protein VMS00_15395 [Acidimicrobiales bacterium]|nr:hypothetical protein [Acidimicrobiales bacterium]